MDTKDKLIGIAMILAGVAFIVLGAAFLIKGNKKVDVYNEKPQTEIQNNVQNNVYNETQVPNDIYQEMQ